jgi:threonine dehydrogenase-like Zn-dependent dehydrogenase
MMNSMVAYLEGPYNLIYRDEVVNNIVKEGVVTCRTIVSAISPGTEVSAYVGMEPLRPGVSYPRLVGYCNVSEIIKVGENSKYSVGERVLTFQSHRQFFNIDESEILAKIPDGVNSKLAACSYLYHLGYDAILKSKVKLGTPVVVLGLGVLGLGAVAMASLAGGVVYAVSDYKKTSKLAKDFGAKDVFTREQLPQLLETLGDRLADVLITTSGSWKDWSSALKITGQNGHIAVIGFPGRGGESIKSNPLDSQYFYMKQLNIQAVGWSPEGNDARRFNNFNEKSNLEFILDRIKDKTLDPIKLISDTYLWKDLDMAYQDFVARRNSPITYIIEWKK